MKKKFALLAAVCFVLLAGCGDTINGKAIAEPEVDQFHERLKAHEFQAMYDSTSAEFKAASSRATIVALFKAIDRKLGSLQESKQVNWSVKTLNLTTTVVLVYASRFQEGEATETFTFRVKGTTAELLGYNISSLDMLIK